MNADPVAQDDHFGVDYNATVQIAQSTLTANDTDPDAGDTLAVTGFDATTAQGVAVSFVNGTFTYHAPTNFTGLDTFQYTLGDGHGGSDIATVTLRVGVNDPPVRTAGSPAAITVDEDSANTTAVSLGLSGLTYGPGGGADESAQTLSYEVTAIPTFITVWKADGTTQVTAGTTVTLAELQGLKYKTGLTPLAAAT
jgi:hypothetical protein